MCFHLIRRDFLRIIGEGLGVLTLVGFIGSMLNFLIKWWHKKYAYAIKASNSLKKMDHVLIRFFVRHHVYWGVFTATMLMAHFVIQSTYRYVSMTGVFAGSLLLFQALLGIIGVVIFKKRRGLWWHAHRIMAIVLFLGILRHLLVK